MNAFLHALVLLLGTASALLGVAVAVFVLQIFLSTLLLVGDTKNRLEVFALRDLPQPFGECRIG